jgi:molybdopterin-guanine dinucleotide biosynthesis protein A
VISGAVLCGGASRRMGTDKALVPVDGVPMAERVARALAAAGCTPVTMIGGDATALAAVDRPHRADRWPGEGPLGGVITALGAERDAVVVAACDLPRLDAATVAALLDAARDAGPTIDVVVAHTGRLEPALAWWSPRALPRLERSFAAGVRALHEAITTLHWQQVAVDPDALRNVNTPSDVPPPD